jgi:hypothetical protein
VSLTHLPCLLPCSVSLPCPLPCAALLQISQSLEIERRAKEAVSKERALIQIELEAKQWAAAAMREVRAVH